jgi:hypothetical protein
VLKREGIKVEEIPIATSNNLDNKQIKMTEIR